MRFIDSLIKRKRMIGVASAVGAIILAVLFGSSVLEDVHLAYLRALSNWTVKITNTEGNAGATGFVAKGKSGRKYIITNGHVCGLNEDGKLSVYYRGDRYIEHVLKLYDYNDLCAIEAPSTIILPVHIAFNYSLGERVYAVGHPLLQPKTVTEGELSGLVGVNIVVKANPEEGECKGPTYKIIPFDIDFMGITSICIRTLTAQASTLSIQPGNSGSPIVNIFGSVVGVAFASNESGTRSYVVPLEDLKDFLGSL